MLLGYACEIPRDYCRAKNFSAKSDLRVNSADFEVGKDNQIIREKQRPLIINAKILDDLSSSSGNLFLKTKRKIQE